MPPGSDPSPEGGSELERLETLTETLRGKLAAAMARKADGAAGGSDAAELVAGSGLALLELKQLNRRVWELVGEYKEGTQRANAGVDAAELKLQNLQYEKNHFLREITHLRDFRQDAGPRIELLPESEFAAAAPEELRGTSKAADPHQFHLNRLELERRQRESLCGERDARAAERTAAAERNAEKRAFLEGLQAQLASLTTLSLPLQRLLEQKHTQRWNERRTMHLLAPPLRALYVRAVAYRDTAARHLELSIVGNLAEAEALAEAAGAGTALASPSPRRAKRQRVSSAASAEEGPGAAPASGGAGGGGAKEADEKEEGDEEAEEDEASRLHPLRVRVTFRPAAREAAGRGEADGDGEAEEGEAADDGEVAEGGAELQLQFCCLASAGLLAAQLIDRPSSLLVNLFDLDSGADLPPATLPSGLAPDEALVALLPSVPFRWAQELGSDLPSGAVSAHALPALRRFEQVIDAISARVSARADLATELQHLEQRRTAPLPPAQPLMPPAPLVSALTAWTEVADPTELPPATVAALARAPAWRRVAERVFTATLERTPAGTASGAPPVRLSATLQLFADYPRARPAVSLSWLSPPARVAAGTTRALPPTLLPLASPAALRLAERHAGEAADNQLLQMEAELNAPAAEVDRQGAPYHLLWVLHRARMLLDVYLETEGVGGGATAAVCGTLCNRRVRGRDRRKPFHFSKTTSQFDQAI